jgi:hypothetical protein
MYNSLCESLCVVLIGCQDCCDAEAEPWPRISAETGASSAGGECGKCGRDGAPVYCLESALFCISAFRKPSLPDPCIILFVIIYSL